MNHKTLTALGWTTVALWAAFRLTLIVTADPDTGSSFLTSWIRPVAMEHFSVASIIIALFYPATYAWPVLLLVLGIQRRRPAGITLAAVVLFVNTAAPLLLTELPDLPFGIAILSTVMLILLAVGTQLSPPRAESQPLLGDYPPPRTA